MSSKDGDGCIARASPFLVFAPQRYRHAVAFSFIFPPHHAPTPLPVRPSHASILVAPFILFPLNAVVIDSCFHQGKAKGCPCRKKPCLDSHIRTRISSVTIATNDKPETQRKYLFRRFLACCCSSQESLLFLC